MSRRDKQERPEPGDRARRIGTAFLAIAFLAGSLLAGCASAPAAGTKERLAVGDSSAKEQGAGALREEEPELSRAAMGATPSRPASPGTSLPAPESPEISPPAAPTSATQPDTAPQGSLGTQGGQAAVVKSAQAGSIASGVPAAASAASESTKPAPSLPSASAASNTPASAAVATTSKPSGPTTDTALSKGASTGPTLPRPADFGQRGLAELSTLELDGKIPCVLWNTEGRRMATGLLVFGGYSTARSPEASGAGALALALLAREIASASGDPQLTATIVDLGRGDLGILFEGRPATVFGALSDSRGIANAPSFMRPGYPVVALQSALRALRLAAETRAVEGEGASAPDLGEISSLLEANLESARRAWGASYSRSSLLAVISADRRSLASSALDTSPLKRSGPLPLLDGQAALILSAETAALGEGRETTPPWRLTASGVALSPGMSGIAAAAFGTTPQPQSLARAKARALYRLFGAGDDGRGVFAIALDLLAGGDGSLPFRLASAIEGMDAARLVGALGGISGEKP